jgi:hypothetical protein
MTLRKGKLVGYNSLHGSGYRIYKPYPNRPKGTLHDVRDIIIDGSDFSIYHNPDLPPIDTYDHRSHAGTHDYAYVWLPAVPNLVR